LGGNHLDRGQSRENRLLRAALITKAVMIYDDPPAPSANDSLIDADYPIDAYIKKNLAAVRLTSYAQICRKSQQPRKKMLTQSPLSLSGCWTATGVCVSVCWAVAASNTQFTFLHNPLAKKRVLINFPSAQTSFASVVKSGPNHVRRGRLLWGPKAFTRGFANGNETSIPPTSTGAKWEPIVPSVWLSALSADPTGSPVGGRIPLGAPGVSVYRQFPLRPPLAPPKNRRPGSIGIGRQTKSLKRKR